MGISGLLPLLKSIHKPCNLKKFAGQTIGVDAYGWLHRGTVACAIELALGKPTTKFVDFAMNRVRMLIHFGVIPYIVFDGDYLPSKAATELERAKRRAESRKTGLELHRLGRPSQAHLELQKAVDVTPEMARQLMEELKKVGVQYVVAPYEADAQLTYLERKGIIQGILSEDSDLLVFGAKRLLTKLDQYGDCIEINRNDFTACRDISLAGWSDAEFRRMAILSGCDYLPNINQMGLKTAYRLVRKHKTIEQVLRMLQFDGKYRVPTGYLEAFRKAELTFLHQRVFCPVANALVMTTELSGSAEPEDFAFIGNDVEPGIAIGVARGDLHPMTKKPIIVDVGLKETPRTAWTASRKTLATPTDLKSHHTIESFFKLQRTPLAELDPNSFTPSPSQQRLFLQQQNRSWTPSPAPPRLPLPGSSVPSPAPSQASTRPNLNEPRTDGNDPSFSAPHPPKRQRLCSVLDDQKAISKEEATMETRKSRFFASAVAASSLPSKGKRKSKRTDINIWSDDSVEDIMAGIPDFTGHSQSVVTKEKITVFLDQKSVGESQASLVTDGARSASQVLGSTDTTASTSQRDTRESTPATSYSSSGASQVYAQILDKNVAVELTALSEEYSFKPSQSPMKVQPQRNERFRPGDMAIKPDYVRAKPQLLRGGSLTSLQRLGVKALSRTRPCSGPVQPGLTERKNIIEASSIKRVMACQEKSPQLPQFLPEANFAGSCSKGSEDLIVPNSEDEGEDLQSPTETEEPGKSRLNLGRFAFAG
ncbi:exonuclease [Lasallia pustulata]|uniref:Exonuclease n=1 Tax=Lasallia pustulata TaxID=136370 RepID=A0A1W5D297_9LECA|nr:exonuclease [Lasallia pustulata]